MALWRNIGGLNTISAGATVYWEYYYPPGGRDVGVAIAAPNLQSANINVPLVMEQGIVERQTPVEEGAPQIHYTLKVRNLGAGSLTYNLNIGDWQ
jgi:hypothetical protein